MPQLFAQQDRQPDVWVMSGAPTATVVYLSLDTTINYSSGSPDTLHANTPAVIYGTLDTAFDRSLDVWVPFTVRASGVLSIIKESLLGTLTADYVAMARVELHSIKPYQPEPYLASGGLGSGGPTTIVLASDTSALAHSLWTGSGNSAPPAGWQTLGYDDSAWAHAIITVDDAITYVAGGHTIWSPSPVPAQPEQALLRHHVALPGGAITSATLVLYVDTTMRGLYVNGIAEGSVPHTFPPPLFLPVTYSIPPSDLIPGADNVLAIWGENDANPGDPGGNFDYTLTIAYSSTAGIASPGGTEGDLLYYHSGTWRSLPVGASGRVLSSDGTDPGWATPATSGTVSSVGLSLPGIFSVSGSPITTSGTFAVTLQSENVSTVFAGPASGSAAAPTFRALQGADLPASAGSSGHVHAHGKFL